MPPQVQGRVGRAGNGTPVFLVPGQTLTHGRVFGATWDPERALWMYPAFHPAAQRVLEDFDTVSGELAVTWSDTARQHIRDLERVATNLREQRVPDEVAFVTLPRGAQIEGLCHVYYNLRAALFFDPGLGKSKIAIDLTRLLRARGNREPSLVLGPRMTLQYWGREVDQHSGGQLRWAVIEGTRDKKKDAIKRAADERPDIILATYDTVRSLVDLLVDQLPYATLVCDECHLVKSWKSDRTKATYEVAQKAARRLVMTGSPTQGTPLDLYGIYKILGDCFMPEDFGSYQKKFIDTVPHTHVVRGYKNLDVLNARTNFVAIRRTKEECLDLPERQVIDLPFYLTEVQATVHNQLVEEMQLDPEQLAIQLGHRPGTKLPPRARMPHRAAVLTKLMQVVSGFLIKNESDPSFCDQAEPGGCRHLATCVEERIRPRTPACLVDQTPLPNTVTFFDENPKMDLLAEKLDEIMQVPERKVIVWCTYQHEMDLAAKVLADGGWDYVRVDGETEDLQEQVDLFNLNPSVRVYLSQASMGVGVTLNVAEYMIYCSLPMSLTTYLQSLDRNYRIGQTKKVVVYRLIGVGTPQVAVAKLLDNKVDIDEVLTKKIDCVICEHYLRCLEDHIEPFDRGCVYQRNMPRLTIKARKLPVIRGDT